MMSYRISRSGSTSTTLTTHSDEPPRCENGSVSPRWATSSTARPGRPSSSRWRELGYSVFLDAKLHDIPHTVERGAYVLARYGLGYLNVHGAAAST